MHHMHLSKHKNKTKTHPSTPFSFQNHSPKLTFRYDTRGRRQAVMEQLQENQVVLQEEVSQIRQLMETIQAVARGQEVMAKMQEEMNQCASTTNPLTPPAIETPTPVPQVDPLININAPAVFQMTILVLIFLRQTTNSMHSSAQGMLLRMTPSVRQPTRWRGR